MAINKIVTIQQIKAARALLGWSQDDLSAASGLSKPALANFERGASHSRIDTIESISGTLEKAGIEFLDDGVRCVKDRLEVETFQNADAIQLLWEDIHQTLEAGEERLISNVDEKRFLAATRNAFAEMMQRYEAKGITGRILSQEGDTNFADPTSTYRWVSKSRFRDIAYYVYADKYAMLLWEPKPRVILIKNKIVADSYRKQFERLWKEAQVPK